MPSYTPTIEQLKGIQLAVLEGATYPELRARFPSITPGFLSELYAQGAELRALRHAPAPSSSSSSGHGNGAGNGAGNGQAPAQSVVAPAYQPAPPAPAAYPPASYQPAPFPAHAYFPPPVDPAAALKPAVDMMVGMMQSLVAVLTSERTRTPWAELPELLTALRAQQPAASMPLDEFIKAFREGLQIGSQATKELERESSPAMETAREVASAITAIMGARAAAGVPTLPAPGQRPTGPAPAAAPAPMIGQAPPAPPARSAAAGPAWDAMREVCIVVDYALRTEDDPAHAVKVARERLPQDVLMRLTTEPAPMVVDWLMRQAAAIPAVANAAVPEETRRRWLRRFVAVLRGEQPEPEPEELEDELEDEDEDELEGDELEDEDDDNPALAESTGDGGIG